MMIPGLEKELTGMKVGGEKHVTVKPEDGYGKVNPNAVQEFPKEKIPANALKVGAVLAARSPEGMVVPMTVREIKEKTVVMDLNHPMAGKTLVFDVKVVDIQPAPPPPAQPAKPIAPTKPVTPPAPAKRSEPANPAEPAKK
jgi:FKBP-type peptidyl-prolyl cis-trans isomerase 2